MRILIYTHTDSFSDLLKKLCKSVKLAVNLTIKFSKFVLKIISLHFNEFLFIALEFKLQFYILFVTSIQIQLKLN